MKYITDEKYFEINARTRGDLSKKNFGKWVSDFTLEEEWKDNNTEWANRDHEIAWEQRYKYESEVIVDIINQSDYKNILEIGCGPGKLSQMIQSKLDLDYHLIDKKFAKERFNKRNYKGKFFVKDLFNEFDTSELNKNYDMIIVNDFLEHVANPSDVVKSCWNLCNKDSILFVSVQNWRMGHNFIYRGLFDYDNFIHFMELHGFKSILVIDSPLITPDMPRLTSEITMPEELRRSWNWYFVFRPLSDQEIS